MKKLSALLALAVMLILAPALAAQTPPPGQPDAKAVAAQVRRISEQLHPVHGDVRVAGANAMLHLGQDYYFLPANEARIVLDAWGNPMETTQDVLGMVFPAGKTFTDDTWAAVVTYQDSGYVADDDAESADYGALMTQMQGEEGAVNAERARLGLPAQHLVGWAQPPAYDRQSHSVVWARNVRFSDASENTLNYDVRLLGRRGVLSLNLVTVMSKLAETRAAAARFARSVEFTPGERYADFQPGRDRVAEYGVAGLVAAGIGATIAKKAGVLALILAFGKKIIIFLIAGIALAWRWIRRLFGAKDEEEEAAYYEEPLPADPAMAAQVEPVEAEPGPPVTDAPAPER